MRLEEVEQPLARLVPADEEHVRCAVLPARDGDGAGEPADVDAVGDDLVVAREEPVDEMARRGTDRDPAVEPLRMATQRTAAELIGGREAGIRMERGDVDAGRFTQQEQRQERHERLVEMEHVEPLALEHRADLTEVAGRERERADGGVDRHREPDPEPDDVALRRALRSMARRQDADVVAALSQVLVEVLDVLGDAAAGRVDVRADEADLHDAAGGS